MQKIILILALQIFVTACQQQQVHELITIADARTQAAQIIDTGDPGDSPGDILVFDQPLLTTSGEKLGNNSGACIRTRVDHSYQCQWTLSFESGSIQVGGREYDRGESAISITGGCGIYTGISGEMISKNNGDGTFTQTLRYSLR